MTWQHTDTQTGTSWITPSTTNFRDYAETLGVGVYYDDLRQGIDGLYIPDPPSLFIRPGKHPHYENWLGWHELGHHITGTRHITTVAGRARVEDLCDRIAAENILPLPLLANPALFDPDFAQWAYNLRVPPRALKTRLNSLSRLERPRIDPLIQQIGKEP